VRSRIIQTPRLAQHVYESGQPGAEPILLVHGNASSARFFEELMAALPDFYVVAPDLRGYGASEPGVVDATRGVRDYSDDLQALMDTLGLERFHLLGWSLGGNIAMQFVLDFPERVRTLTLHASGSPYGFGATHGADGRPNYDDFAGSGGGIISPQVRACYEAKDSTADSPFAPRSGLRSLFVKPSSFHFAPEREDVLVEQMLLMAIGDQHYPGDSVPSPNWPFVAPGHYGSNNALSPKNMNQSGLADLRGGPPILWVRGADDQVVADAALADPAALGKLGAIPGWPGDDICPPQPMVTQMRAVLDRYATNGGAYREEVIADCGHSPLLEHPEAFRALFTPFVRAAAPRQATPATPPAAPREPTPRSPAEPASDSSAHAAPPRRGLFGGLFGRRRG
jgi:pimeloyl-ACP methyl ester carboxylesterase